MGFRSVSRAWMTLPVTFALLTGCGESSSSPGPVEEPNIGPGAPAGGKPGTKNFTTSKSESKATRSGETKTSPN